jgi:hypothetical protein
MALLAGNKGPRSGSADKGTNRDKQCHPRNWIYSVGGTV